MADISHHSDTVELVGAGPAHLSTWKRLFSHRRAVEELFALAGVKLGGDKPWDIKVHNERLYRRVIADGSVGLGEAYMDGDWDCPALDQLFDRIISAQLGDRLGLTIPLVILRTAARLQNRQTISRSREVADVHYNLPIDIHEATYDRRLTASCAYWKDAADLNAAQEAKLDLICRKIGLKAGHTVLDIGCGWGSFIGFAAEKYGASCTGVTVSSEQVAYGEKRYRDLPVRPLLLDYRRYTGPKVDRLVSVGMFEHVGHKNYGTYFSCARQYLKDDGLFLLHTIWENERYPAIDAWQDKYIFPNGDLPSLGEITSAVEGLFVVEDVHNFGAYYDKTLMAWNANFQSRRPAIVEQLGERFARMWEYYLLQNAAAFRSRHINVGQFVLSPRGLRGGYETVR
ncbi:MAG TPA: cyclopropane fatty acyl phospholipid synthase [Rhizomicrobium sp.]|nr:cyclopropane fatty acyl phospholipid synthase [Rhizomicrobium sp.]